MQTKEIELIVYGTEQICASCVNMPSSKETYDWLQAAIGRKFPNQPLKISYVDINEPPTDNEKKRLFAERVIEEDLFYPVVVIEDDIVGEGDIRLKKIYAELEKYGYIAG